MNINVTHIDTACILLEINGYRILTDPTLDRAGGLYYHGFGAVSRKTENPGLTPEQLFDIDLILLSHHQHKDNLDINGRALLNTVETVISTIPASKAIKGVIGLANWETYEVINSKLAGLKITATPAQHRPWWIPEFVSGKVIGFIIEFDDQPNGVIYLSGDTVFFKGIKEVAKRYEIDIAFLNVGAVQFRYLTGLGRYTMNSADLIKAVQVLDPKKVFPVHTRGWTHFKEKENDLKHILNQEPLTNYRTIFLEPGKKTSIYPVAKPFLKIV